MSGIERRLSRQFNEASVRNSGGDRHGRRRPRRCGHGQARDIGDCGHNAGGWRTGRRNRPVLHRLRAAPSILDRKARARRSRTVSPSARRRSAPASRPRCAGPVGTRRVRAISERVDDTERAHRGHAALRRKAHVPGFRGDLRESSGCPPGPALCAPVARGPWPAPHRDATHACAALLQRRLRAMRAAKVRGLRSTVRLTLRAGDGAPGEPPRAPTRRLSQAAGRSPGPIRVGVRLCVAIRLARADTHPGVQRP